MRPWLVLWILLIAGAPEESCMAIGSGKAQGASVPGECTSAFLFADLASVDPPVQVFSARLQKLALRSTGLGSLQKAGS